MTDQPPMGERVTALETKMDVVLAEVRGMRSDLNELTSITTMGRGMWKLILWAGGLIGLIFAGIQAFRKSM